MRKLVYLILLLFGIGCVNSVVEQQQIEELSGSSGGGNFYFCGAPQQVCFDVYYGGTDSIYLQEADWCLCPDSTFWQGRNGIIDTMYPGKWWIVDLNLPPSGSQDSLYFVTYNDDTIGCLVQPLYWPHPFEMWIKREGFLDTYLDLWEP